ncbi:MAG: hypothetical protein ACSW75_01975 [Lachnospiraceae bacterium]
MKKITVLAVSVVMGAMLLTACGGSSSSSQAATTSSKAASTTTSTATSTVTSTATSTASSTETSAAATAGGFEDLTAADLANPTKTVAYGDFEAMQTLSKAIQNGEATGEVVSVDGEVINFAKGMSYSIGEKDPDAGSRIGTTFVIVGAEEEAYPADKTHVKFTGKVFYDEASYSFKLYTLPDFVVVVEE